MTGAPEMPTDQDSLPDSHLFTVRVWPEALEPGNVEWRGRVQHVLSGEARYFREWKDLIVFVQQMVQLRQEDIP